jgi:hypothetical protein
MDSMKSHLFPLVQVERLRLKLAAANPP